MLKFSWLGLVTAVAGLALAPAARGQNRPYIGFVYPAGGQQGTTVQARLGGQGLAGVHAVLVSGSGVKARVVEFRRRLDNQEVQLLREQLKELKNATNSAATPTSPLMTEPAAMTMSAMNPEPATAGQLNDGAKSKLTAKIEQRMSEFVPTPACAAIATLTIVEVAITPEAEAGPREIRLVTTSGVSNPLTFEIGQFREFVRRPMLTTPRQVLGKEAQALRKRPVEENEDHVTVPCVLNGQIASGEVDRYRFDAQKGQRLVLTTHARQLVPFIADAVPGWFQAVLTLRDANGRELAYGDDYRFDPDPTIFFEVPRDGEYVVTIHDSLYRGREDFVYRITIGELPFITSFFPLGGRVGEPTTAQPTGWNLDGAPMARPSAEDGPGVRWLTANRQGVRSNRVPFALDTLPECVETNLHPDLATAQVVTLPIIVNGRIETPRAWDVFAFAGTSNAVIVAEVQARRLESPLDSVIKLTDATGAVLAFNDDHEDLGAGQNTHEADSYLMARLPADGTYYVHLGDTAGRGGVEYGYRLRLSAPRPDFALRVTPTSAGLKGKANTPLTVYALRQDGFAGSIKLTLKDPPTGLSAAPVTLGATQTVARLTLKSDLSAPEEPRDITIVGSAKIAGREVAHEAVPAEDQMQAFLWRHLVPANDLKVLVFDPASEPAPRRVARRRPTAPVVTNAVAMSSVTPMPANPLISTNTTGETNATAAAASAASPKSKFTKQQIAGRLRQLKQLHQDELLTDEFYDAKVAECEAAD